MKNEILLKSLFLFALLFTVSSGTYASEVTGTLSSTGMINNSGSSSSQGGSLSGIVISNNTSSGGSSGSIARNTGSVLGVSTSEENSQNINLSYSDYINSDDYSDMNVYNETNQPLISSTSSLVTDEIVSGQAASSARAYSGLSLGSWFWIIFSILLLIIIAIYFYMRSFGNKKQIGKI